MRPLPPQITRNGFTYTQVLRNGRLAIYRQEGTPNLAFYEVFIVRIRPEKELFGKIIPKREVFPGNEEFGKTAWSFDDLREAIRKYNELEQLHQSGYNDT